jgi:hypothetical protein
MSKAAELANLIGNINAGGGGVNRNVVVNGAMNVAQRATSSTGIGASSGYFTCDRFYLEASGTAGRLTSTQDSSAPSGFANSLKLDCTTADTSIASGELLILEHRIEGQNLQAFAKGTSDAKPFAVSFYVKGNASATYVAELYDNDNSRAISKTFSVTTDWTRVELTYPADTTGAFGDDNGSSLVLGIWLHAGSTYTSGTLQTSWGGASAGTRAGGISSFFDSTDRTFFITGVQLEVGQNPTSFEHEPFDVTREKCYRYTYKLDGSTQYSAFGAGKMNNGTDANTFVTFPKELRAKPTIAHEDISKLRCDTTTHLMSYSTVINYLSKYGGLYNVTGMSGVSSHEQGCILRFETGDSHILFDAEL